MTTTTTLSTNVFPSNPLFAALLNDSDFDTMTRLLREARGADRKTFLATIDRNGDTPLIKAVKEARWTVVADLLSIGADVNAVNREGRTAMHHAVDRVVKEGKNINLDMALGHLIEYNASVSIPDATGTTAYDLLVANGYKKLNKFAIAA